MKHVLMTAGATAALAMVAASTPALAASAISAGQWYAFMFGTQVPSAISGPAFNTGTDGPLPGGGTEDSINAPTGSSWSITLARSSYVTFTDLETSGDQFQVFVNGVGATPTTNTLSPAGQAGLTGGLTSTPNASAALIGEDIGGALANSDFSSGTFLLPQGTDIISANYLGVIGNGDGAFFVGGSAVPEPATWAIMLIGFGGIGASMRTTRQKRNAATA
ncbi:MAG TPA: PEPxxWA-CTERM sorting domain-containing protein [Caulobacteraceae bacterium]|jgi:hypothetical protein|nr:PEPxxWA-CTERM sorting domain-containing protein [Caulobacteraceae bacterium]